MREIPVLFCFKSRPHKWLINWKAVEGVKGRDNNSASLMTWAPTDFTVLHYSEITKGTEGHFHWLTWRSGLYLQEELPAQKRSAPSSPRVSKWLCGAEPQHGTKRLTAVILSPSSETGRAEFNPISLEEIGSPMGTKVERERNTHWTLNKQSWKGQYSSSQSTNWYLSSISRAERIQLHNKKYQYLSIKHPSQISGDNIHLFLCLELFTPKPCLPKIKINKKMQKTYLRCSETRLISKY